MDSREYREAHSCCELSANLNGRDSDNLQSEDDPALVFPIVGNVVPELSKNLVAWATLTDDLGQPYFRPRAYITLT